MVRNSLKKAGKFKRLVHRREIKNKSHLVVRYTDQNAASTRPCETPTKCRACKWGELSCSPVFVAGSRFHRSGRNFFNVSQETLFSFMQI